MYYQLHGQNQTDRFLTKLYRFQEVFHFSNIVRCIALTSFRRKALIMYICNMKYCQCYIDIINWFVITKSHIFYDLPEIYFSNKKAYSAKKNSFYT